MEGTQRNVPVPAARDDVVVFHQFNDLPPEIRAMIWECAIPDDVSEVYALKIPLIRPNVARPTVYTCFPTVAHVSREARDCSLSRIKTSFCSEAGIHVPCRDFRPDLDVLYIGAFTFFAFFSKPEFFYGGFVHQLRHIAVDIVLTSTGDRIPNVFRYLDRLETLTVVFGEARGDHRAGEVIHLSHPLHRRCRLRPFTAAELEATNVGDPNPRIRSYRSVSSYLAMLRGSLEHHTKELLPSWDEVNVGVWDYEKQRLELEVNAQAFVEFHLGPDGPEWVEKGNRRNTIR